MGQETQDLLIRLRSDSTGVEEGNRRAAKSFDDLKTVALGTAAGLGAVAGVIKGIVEIAQRGQGFSELESSFKRLGQTDGDLNKLRGSLQGLVTDTDIFRAANQALTAGLKPEQFQAAAAAADALGDSVGKDTKTALDDLTLALTKGNDRLLAQYGILIDNQKAYDDYGKKIGLAGNQLNELGKVEATREAIIRALAEKTKNLGEETTTVADEYTRLSNTIAGSIDRFAAAINSSQTLAGVFRDLGHGVDLLSEQLLGLGSIQAKAVALQNQIGAAEGKATAHTGFEGTLDSLFGAGPTPENLARVASLKQQYADLIASIKTTTNETKKQGDSVDDLRKKYGDLGKAGKDAATASWDAFQKLGLQITNQFNDIWSNGVIFGENSGERDIAAERLEASFKRSTDFFSDLLTPMFEGQAANFEDIFKDAAKRIAIGFGSQMLASLTASLGLGNLGSIGGAGGLGGSLAASLGFGGGGTPTLGSVLPGAAGGAGGAGAGSLSMASLGPIAAIVATAAATALTAHAISKGDKVGGGIGGLVLGGATGGALGFLGAGFFGDSEKSKEREARESIIDQIFGGDLSFGGGSIDPSKFNASGKFGGQGTALVNPFAHSLSGGDDKLGSDLAGIFENAVTEGDSFNETIVKTLSLMDKLGTNADETKDAVSQLFLDGKISLEEFSADIDNLNVLAQEDLTGPNSVADAIQIVTENLDNPRVALKGLELAFKEMADLGIDSSEEIHAYITEKFGPQVAAAFDHITAAGLDTWDEIGSAGPDQLKLIFNELKPLQVQFDSTAESARQLGEADMGTINDGLKKGISLAKEFKKELDAARRAAEGVASTNAPLNQRPA